MKALSILQPFASAVAIGEKTIEVRTWNTNYRGPLLICASGKGCTVDDFFCPGGFALAVAELVDVRRMERSDLSAAAMDIMPSNPSFAWVLRDAEEIEPFPVKGKLRLFDVEPPFLRILPEKFADHIDYFERRWKT